MMKLKDGLVLREIAGHYVIVPIRDRVKEIPGVVNISSSEAHLWDYMKDHEFEREDLVNLIMKENNGATRETALADVDNFLEVLTMNNIIDDGIEHGGIPKDIYEKLLKKHNG